MILIKSVPAYVKNIRSKTIVGIILVIFCLTGALFAFKPRVIKKLNTAETNALKVLTGGINIINKEGIL